MNITFKDLEKRSDDLVKLWNEDLVNFATNFLSGHWRKPHILGPLFAMHGRCCAYCQGVLTQSDRGDVEHFRPKGLYWWLGYDFQNYLLSCSRCNRSRKRTNFPLAQNARRVTYETRTSLGGENRLLLDPVEDRVEDVITAEIKDRVIFVKVEDGVGDHSTERTRGEFTKEFFKLNKNPLLLKERSKAVFDALEEIQTAIQGDLKSKEKIKEMACRFFPHGIYVRKILASRYPNLPPDLLPDSNDELRRHVAELILDIRFAEAALKGNEDNKDARETKDICCWALATLWKEPPSGSVRQMESWLEASGKLTEIQQYYDKL